MFDPSVKLPAGLAVSAIGRAIEHVEVALNDQDFINLYFEQENVFSAIVGTFGTKALDSVGNPPSTGTIEALEPTEARAATRELLHTAVTRSRRRIVAHGCEESIAAAIGRVTARASGLRDILAPAGPGTRPASRET